MGGVRCTCGIARFDGGVGGDIQAEIDLMRREFEAVKRGEQSDYLPSGLVNATDRVEVLSDRDGGSVMVLVYCRAEEQARRGRPDPVEHVAAQ